MKGMVVLALLLAGHAGSQTHWQEAAYANIGGWQPVSSWCDTPGRVLALTAPEAASGPVTLAQWWAANSVSRGGNWGGPIPVQVRSTRR